MQRKIGASFGVVTMILGGVALADGPAQKVSIEDYLAAQGSTVFYMPPTADYWGWTAPAPGVKTPASSYVGGNEGSCDYANISGQWLADNGGPDLGTTVTGSVTKRKLDDGRILVQVETHTANALSFGLRIEAGPYGNFATDPLVFGARPVDVLEGATPAIGECHASFSWKQSDGPLVDMNHGWDQDPNFEIVKFSFRATAVGPLTSESELGPDGTPGKMIISQTGFFRTSFKGATADAFPAEYVEFRKIGK